VDAGPTDDDRRNGGIVDRAVIAATSEVPDSGSRGNGSGWLSRRSSRVFIGALVTAAAALALTLYQGSVQRAFAAPTTSAMGTVRSHGALLGRGRYGGSESFCWVSYEFTPANGAVQRNWSFWAPACGVTRGRPIHIQYVIARPEVNRPAGDTASFSPLFLWFASGVVLVIAILVRSAQDGD
jgi:hypothetical protein